MDTQNQITNDIFSTDATKRIERTREEALSSYMAGQNIQTPYDEQTKPAKINQDTFSTQQQVLSKLNLLDESLTPTDTYTNYINQGGSPVPGYEQDHDSLLFLDKVNSYQQEIEQGTISKNAALWDLYGHDILQQNGYNLESVGWWQSKFNNHDYSNPLKNQPLISSVLSQAESYHNTLLAQEYAAKKKVQDSHLSTLLNKGDLSNEDIKTLFPELVEALDKIKDEDHDYQWYISSNQVPALSRVYQSETGDRYYLHTDGELYKLSNTEKGSKIASFQENQDGTLKEISLNSGDVIDGLQEFKAGAFSVVSGFGKLVMGLWGGTGGWLVNGLTEGDWNYVDSITEAMSDVDAFNNDNVSLLFDSGRVDMDGFQANDPKDWAMFACNLTGMMVGGWATGAVAGKIAGAGHTLAQNGGWLSKVTGKSIEYTANLYARSTGLYRGYTNSATPGVLTIFGKNLGSIGGWAPTLNHAKTVSTYMLKDFQNNLQQLNQQKFQYRLQNPDEELPDDMWKMIGVSATNAAFNGMISMIFAGGIDDNQTERWISALTPKSGSNFVTKHLTPFLTKYSVGINIASEFIDNATTIYTGNIIGWDNERNSFGDMITNGAYIYDENGNKKFDTTIAMKSIIQGAITTIPTASGQLQRRNIAGENAHTIWTKLLSDLDKKEADASTPENKHVVRELKALLVESFNDESLKDQTLTQRIFTVLDNAHDQLKDGQGNSIVTKAIKEVCDPKMMSVYKEMNDAAIASYNKYLDKQKNNDRSQRLKGVRRLIDNTVGEYFRNKYTQRNNAVSFTLQDNDIQTFSDNLYKYFVKATGISESENSAEVLRKQIEVTAEELDRVEDVAYNYNEYAKTHDKEAQLKAHNAAEVLAETLGVDTQLIKDSTKYFTFKNETDDRLLLRSNLAAMTLLTRVLPNAAYKIDDYTYGIVGSGNNLSNMFTNDVANKMLLSMHALGKNKTEAAVDLYMKTLLGDELFKHTIEQDKAMTKELVEDFLNTAIESKVIEKHQAAEFLLTLKDKAEEKTLLHDTLSKVFNTELTIKNVTNSGLSDLETYAVLYRAARQLQEPGENRFSGPTIAAEVILDMDTNVSREVIKDLVDNHLVNPDFEKLYYSKLQEYSKEEVFKLATNKFRDDLVEIIGEVGLKNIPSEQDLATSNVGTFLKALAGNTKDANIKNKINALIDFSKTLEGLNGITFNGDKITLDLTSYMHKNVEDFIKEVARTQPGSEVSRENKDTYSNKPSDKAAETFLDTATKLVDSGHMFVTIDLNNTDMDTIKKIYNLMSEAKMFNDMADHEPKDVEEFKNYIHYQLNDTGKAFAKYKRGTEFKTNIIPDKDAKTIMNNLHLISDEDKIARIREINPDNKVVAEYDYYTLLYNNIEIKKISSQMKDLMRTTVDEDGTPTGIVVNPVKFGTEKKGFIPAFIKLLTGVKSKDGRTASKTGEKFAAINTTGKASEVNKDMATKIMLNKYIDFIYELPAIDVTVQRSELDKLQELGLINRDDAFYQSIDIPGEDYVRLVLSKDRTAMKHYIETNDAINLYKILPFYSREFADLSLNFNTPQAKLLGDIPDIQNRGTTTYTNVMSILNMTFDFDQSYNLKTNLFRDFFANKKKLDYNPFSKNNISLNIEFVRDKLGLGEDVSPVEVYKKYREGSLIEGADDYLYALVETYKQLQNTYVDDEKNDDHLIWLHNPNVLKRMIKWAQSDTDVDTVIKETIKAYGDATYRGTIGDYDAITLTKADNFIVGSSYGIPSNVVGVDTVISKALLDNDMGIQYELVDTNGKPMMANANQQITDAYNYVKNLITKYSSIQEMLANVSKPVDRVFRIYEPSDVIKLQAIFGASEGNIMIEDLDALTRIEADAYNTFFEKLGMESGYGAKVYKKVITLKEQLMKHIGKAGREKITVSSVTKQGAVIPGAANLSEDYQTIPKARGNLKGINKYLTDPETGYIRTNRDIREINASPDRLIDVLSNEYKEVASDYLREQTGEELDQFAKAYNENIQGVAVRDNADINGQTLVADITSDISLYKKLNTARNTKASFDTELAKLELSYTNKEVEDNLINYVTNLTHRASGVDYLNNWAKYSFLDPKTGKEFDMANIEKIGSTTSHIDLLNTVLKHENNLIGKMFIDLDKHKVDSMDGLSFRYKYLKNAEDVSNLKTDLMLKVIQENVFKAGGNYKDAFDLVSKMTQKELQVFLQKAGRDNLGTVAKTRHILSLMDETNIQVPYKYIIQPQNYKNDLLKNFIADHFGTATAARFDKDPMVRNMFKVINFGIDYDGMDEDHKGFVDTFFTKALNHYAEVYSEDVNKVSNNIVRLQNKLNNQELEDNDWASYRKAYNIKDNYESDKLEVDDKARATIKFILDNGKTPEVLSYLFNKRKSLNTMYKEYTKGMPDFYKMSDGSKLSVQELNNFLQEGTKSSLRKIIFFDTEGSNKTKPTTGNKADSIHDLFQISFVTYTKDELGNLNTEQVTKFIKHDISAEDWVKLNIDSTDSFYKNNKEYQNAVEAYTKASEEDMLSYDQVKDILTGRLSSVPDAVVAYNGRNYEFKVLANELAGVKTLDAIDTVLKGYSDTTQKIGQEDVYKRTFSTDRGEKHSADQDTLDMIDLIKNIVNTDMSIAEDRSRLVINLKNLVNVEDESKLRKIFAQANQFFVKDEDYQNIIKKFDNYEPTLDNIKQMQRAYNYLMNDMDGRALFDILDQLDANSTYAQFVNLSKGQIDNALDIISIKMLETNGNYNEALNLLTNTIFNNENNFDNKSFGNFITMLGNKDTKLLEKAGIDLDLLNNDTVKLYKKNLVQDFTKGEYGIKNKKISTLANADEAKAYAENYNNISYITGAQSMIIDNKDFISEVIQKDLINVLGSGMLSLKEGMDVSELQSRIDTHLTYNSKLVDSLAAQVNNLIGENRGTGTFRGIYHMSISLNPQENNIKEIEYLGDNKTKRSGNSLTDVKAGEISLTLSMLKEKFNITDLRDIEASDGNLYILSITNPSDTMTPILPLRVRLVEGDEMSAGFTPDTQEILRNRDFDGDHSLTSKLPGSMKEIAPLLYKYMFSPYDVHTKLTNYLSLKSKGISKTTGKDFTVNENSRLFMIGVQNKGVVDACIELDKLLKTYSNEVILPDKANKEIEVIYNKMKEAISSDEDFETLMINLGYNTESERNSFLDKAVKLLGVRETYKNKSDTIRYVNNPALYSKDVDGYETYTYTARKGSFARNLLEKTNISDPIVGYYQKLLSVLPIDSKVINNPLLDLYTPNIYMTDTLESSIDNIVINRDNYLNYIRNLSKYLKAEINIKNFSEDSVNEYSNYVDEKMLDYITTDKDLTDSDYRSLAKQITMESLWDLDFFIKRNAEPIKAFKDAIDNLSEDTEFRDSLDKTMELDKVLKQLTHEKEKVGSKYIPFTPYSDILSQDIVMNKINGINEDDIINGKAFNYGNKLFTDEDRMLKQLDQYSNGFNKVNIFLTKNFSDTSEDTIGVTQNSKARALQIEVWDPTKYNYSVKVGQRFKPGDTIGTDENGDPIKVNKYIYINKITPTEIQVNTESSVVGKKLAAIGIAKGDSKLANLKDSKGNDMDVDLVCDINNAFKNFDKLPYGIDARKLFSKENLIRVNKAKINGKEVSGWILKDIPFNIVGDDRLYRTSIDVKDPSSIRRFELMTTNSSQSLLGVGRFGSTALKTDTNGNIVMDFNEIQKVAETNFKNYDVNYADVGTNIMYYRTDALVNAMSEDEFMGFVNALDNGAYANTFTSREDYLNNVRNSMFKINSEATLNEQLDMIHFLGKERFYKLVDSCKLNQFIFGGLINNLLNKKVNSSFTEEFWSNPRPPRSKNSASEDYSGSERKVVEGKVTNESQRDARFANINHNTLLHLPADVFYKGVTGKNIDTNSILRMHIDGQMVPRYHFANSANIDTDWYAIDTRRGVRYADTLGSFVTADGTKTALSGEADAILIRNLDAGKWTRGIEVDDMLDVEDTPHNANLYNMLGNAYSREYPTTGYSWNTRLGYLFALGLDKNKTNLEKYATLRGVDKVDINKITPQFINDDQKMYYKAILNSSSVPVRDVLKTVNSNTRGYTLRTDLENQTPDLNVSREDVKKLKQDVFDDIRTSREQRMYEEQKAKLYKKAASMLTTTKADYANTNLTPTYKTSDKVIEWKTNWLTRSGIDDRGAEKLSVDIGIKNYKAEIPYIIQEYSEPLNTLKKLVNIQGMKEFEKFAKYHWLTSAKEVDPKNFETRLALMNETEESFRAMKKDYESYKVAYPEIVKAYNDHINNMMELSRHASLVTNEPFSNNFIFMMPFVSTNKITREQDVRSTIRSMASLSKYDPSTPKNIMNQGMMFDFFKGSEKILNDLATTISSNNISQALLGKYNGEALMDNTSIMDEAFKLITTTDAIDSMKPYTKFDSDVTETVLNTVSLYTDLDIKGIKRISKNTQELLRNCFTSVRQQVINLQADLYPEFNKMLSLSEVYRIARGDESNHYNKSVVDACEKLYQTMHGEIIIAQRIMESDKYASSRLNNYINTLYSSGKALVNKFGQKIERNGVVAPTDRASFGYLKENIEIAMNSKTPDMFNQYLLEKALSGELYVMDKDLADQLEKHVWTAPVSNKVQKVLQKASGLAASIQMALPHKMLGRLLRFTGTDYAMGVISNKDVATYIPKAGIELSAALQSQGHNISETLRGYLIREGQPSLGNKGSGVDPLDPTLQLSTFTTALTKPLDFQNHLGRYAIYLAALDGFKKQEAGEGQAWYGSQYYNHEAIDALKSAEDKAMYVMDYMLGSPGGFPALSRKTSGYLMYATFPMNLTRTMGAYAMSVGKLFSEGITAENKTQWYNNIVMPSVGMIGLSMLSNAIIAAVCDYYDVDEETEEEWKKEGVTLDPIGTLIGGTPSVVYDSINPAYQFKEMFINPFTNEYNNTLPKKGYGWFKANILSRLNPMAKIPIELVTGKDLWGDSADGFKNAEGLFETNKKYQYTNIENGMKKVFGILVGSGIANGIVDQVKIDSYDPEDPSLMSSIWKGFTKGIANDMGNQKSWKKDTSNYYSILTDMKSYGKVSKDTYGNTYGNNYYYSIEDMTDAEKLEYAREYGSRYGTFDEQDYNRVNAMLKKMIQNHTDSSTLYNYIVKEYNENNVSEATLRSALNNNSIIRKLRMKSMSGYTKTLSQSELIRLQKAIDYENEYYPILQKLFPDSEYKNTYIPRYQRTYLNSGSGGSSYPKTYTSPTYYYPGKYYPSTYRYNKKTGKYGPNLERVSVNVSPQMAVWNQDYNLTRYDSGLTAENEPKWLRDKGYVNRTN